MNLFPKWMLALAGVNLIPVLLSPFYMFGGLRPFGTSDSTFVRFLLYMLTNAVWFVPSILFFVSLDLFRRGYEKAGVAVALVGVALTATCVALLFQA